MFLLYDGKKQVMEKITLMAIHKNAKKIVFYTWPALINYVYRYPQHFTRNHKLLLSIVLGLKQSPFIKWCYDIALINPCMEEIFKEEIHIHWAISVL